MREGGGEGVDEAVVECVGKLNVSGELRGVVEVLDFSKNPWRIAFERGV